eukprot:g4708.t1
MVYILKEGESFSKEISKMLKQYLRSNNPTVILKALTIVDSLVINCGSDLKEKLLSNKWPSGIARLAERHSDKKIQQAALQLISNYSYTYKDTEFGAAFYEQAESLNLIGLLLPPPTMTTNIVDNKHTPYEIESLEGDFQRGLDFLQLQFPESSNSAANSRLDQGSSSQKWFQTVQKINHDVDRLQDALKQCNQLSKGSKHCEERRRDMLEHLGIARVIAEKCHVWVDNIQAFLILDLEEEELAELLTANDRLHSTLKSWEALVSIEDMIGPTSDSETEGTPIHELKFHSDGNIVSECNLVKMGTSTDLTNRLRAENESLKLALSNSKTNNETALLAAEAKFKEDMKEVKSKAAWRIKQLMSQVADQELNKTRLKRETEDMQFKLISADQALLERSRKSDELEASRKSSDYASDELREDLASAKLKQMEAETRLEEQSAIAEDLKLELVEKEAELQMQRTSAIAEEEMLTEQIEEFAKRLETMRKRLEDDETNRTRLEESERMITTLRLEIKRESILRKKAYNLIRELKGNIRVIARIRPPPTKDTQEQDISAKLHDEYTICLSTEAIGASSSHRTVGALLKRYEFDACFGPQATQEEVYSETSQLIQSALDGYNVCIFCYGQTGSGKTHTLTGSGNCEGIIPLFMRDLFNSDTELEKTSISVYMLELYQEDLLDLLSMSNDTRDKLSIRVDSESGLVTVKGAEIRCAGSSAELKGIFEEGLKRRKTATTQSNAESSRSHLIFTVLLERLNVITRATTKSKITFVDLAGSERIFKSGAINDNQRLNEAKAINKSLSALGDVISALTTKESFIPYRNHKLTELMRDSLGGNAKTLMIVNISSLKSDAKETLNTLDYAQRVKQVTNTNSRSFETREIAQLKAVIDKQNTEIRSLKASGKSRST